MHAVAITRNVHCNLSLCTPKELDKVRMYEEIMTNDDNLESNLPTSSLLKKTSGLHAGTDELKIMCTGDLPLQVNYAVGRLVAVMVYCFRL